MREQTKSNLKNNRKGTLEQKSTKCGIKLPEKERELIEKQKTNEKDSNI